MSREFMAEGSKSPEPETKKEDKPSFLTDRKGERGAVKAKHLLATSVVLGGVAAGGAAAYISTSPEYQAQLEAQKAAHTQPANPDQGGPQLGQRPPEGGQGQVNPQTTTTRTIERPPDIKPEKWNTMTANQQRIESDRFYGGQVRADIQLGRETPRPTVGPEVGPRIPQEEIDRGHREAEQPPARPNEPTVPRTGIPVVDGMVNRLNQAIDAGKLAIFALLALLALTQRHRLPRLAGRAIGVVGVGGIVGGIVGFIALSGIGVIPGGVIGSVIDHAFRRRRPGAPGGGGGGGARPGSGSAADLGIG